MKLLIVRLICFFCIPLLFVLGIYLISDPFKTFNKFNLKEFSTVNRDYLSTELFLKNQMTQSYNSFIFGSSRGCGINTYLWKSYLPEGSNQFLFQAWGETITGIFQKIDFLDKNNVSIKNAIVLLDVDHDAFSDIQQPTTATHVKHYLLSGKSKFYYESILFYAFLKPSEIFQSTKDIFIKPKISIGFDTISNDFFKSNKENWNLEPKQDSTIDRFWADDRPTKNSSKKVIKPEFEKILKDIHTIFVKQKTNYEIVITPAYRELQIDEHDLHILQNIFGNYKVFDFSGRNEINEDKYNFMDSNHFDLIVGSIILKEIYEKH